MHDRNRHKQIRACGFAWRSTIGACSLCKNRPCIAPPPRVMHTLRYDHQQTQRRFASDVDLLEQAVQATVPQAGVRLQIAHVQKGQQRLPREKQRQMPIKPNKCNLRF